MTGDMVTPDLPAEVTMRAGYLLSRLGASAREAFAAELAPLGLRPRHYGALVLLKEHGPASQQVLASGLRVDRSLIVRIIDHLEALGTVERRPDPLDRRRHSLYLTNLGRELIDQCDIIARQVQEKRLAPLSPQQRKNLLDLLTILASHDPKTSTPPPTAADSPAERDRQ